MALITREEFLNTPAPIFHVKVNDPKWHRAERDIMVKWMQVHVGGWFYVDEHDGKQNFTYFFGNEGDMVYFVTWIRSDPFREDYGEILPYHSDADFTDA